MRKLPQFNLKVQRSIDEWKKSFEYISWRQIDHSLIGSIIQNFEYNLAALTIPEVY